MLYYTRVAKTTCGGVILEVDGGGRGGVNGSGSSRSAGCDPGRRVRGQLPQAQIHHLTLRPDGK
jgi:hypothetical protein